MLPPPFAEETQVRGFNRLADAKDFSPLSGIGLLASADSLKKNAAKGVAVIRAVLRTMDYMREPKNHPELVDYILKIHKLDAAVAANALAPYGGLRKTAPNRAKRCKKKSTFIGEALRLPNPLLPKI